MPHSYSSMGRPEGGKSRHLARFQFYEGRNPDWPLKILRKDLEQAVQSHRELRCENRGPQQLVDEHVHPRRAVYTRALTQTMFGCPQTVYNGSLRRATFRYFDARAERPGRPTPPPSSTRFDRMGRACSWSTSAPTPPAT